MKLNEKIINGSIWSLIGTSGYQLFGLAIFVLLSRILSPVDFGTAALAIVFVELTNVIIRFGLVEVVVRTAKDKNVENNVFMATSILGISVSLLFFILAPFIERLFTTPGLAVSLQWLAIVPFMQGLSTVPEGLLRREFKFKALAIRVLGSSVIAGIIAIILAFNGFGFYSLIIQRIISTIFSLLLVWRDIAWRPTLKINHIDFFNTLKQGLPIMFSSLIGQGIFRFVELIIGFFLGPVVLGYFKIAGKLFDVIVQFMLKPIVDVSFSAFSNLKYENVKLERCYLNFVKTCSIVAFPAFVGIGVVGPEAVALFFGEKWAISGNILQILCLGGVSATLNWFFGPLCNATDNSSIPYKIRIFEFSLVITLVALCAQHSIYFVVAANVFVAALITVIMFFILSKKFSFSILRIIKQLIPSLISSLIMGVCVYLCRLFIPFEMHSILKLVVLVCIGTVSYLLINLIFFQSHISDLLKQLKGLKRKVV